MVGVDHLEPCILGGEERPYNSGDGSLGELMMMIDEMMRRWMMVVNEMMR